MTNILHVLEVLYVLQVDYCDINYILLMYTSTYDS